MDRRTTKVTSLTRPDRDEAIASALALVDDRRLVELCCALVNVASPTGDEAPLARVIAGLLRSAAGHGEVQYIDERQANAWGRYRQPPGGGGGPTIMLYAPIDTVTTGDPSDDLPWSAPQLADHARPSAAVEGGTIRGLGAMNPKGHAACVLAAFEAIASTGIALPGEIIAAFGAGGMPTFRRQDATDPLLRQHTGHGVGCSFLIERGVTADAAIIAKSGWAISTAEVGLAWFDIIVRGQHSYVGARRRLPYRNPITDAATIVQHLERWFPHRAETHRRGTLLPQSVVGAIQAGTSRTTAFVPAQCRIAIDMRIGLDQTPLDAQRELEAEIQTLREADPALDVSIEMTAGIPATATDPEHWISRIATAEWEVVAGRPHQPILETSGATDANTLRQHGIPTVRVGLPKVYTGDVELAFADGMNTVSVESMRTLTDHLVRVAIETAGQSLDELRS